MGCVYAVLLNASNQAFLSGFLFERQASRTYRAWNPRNPHVLTRGDVGWVIFLFLFFLQEKNPSFGEDGVWIRNYRLLVSRSYIKSCIEVEVWNYDGCG